MVITTRPPRARPRLDRDAEEERRQTDRLLAGEQQVQRERISAALEAIEDVEGDHVARLRGQLNKALGVVGRAVNLDDLDRELAPYLQDIDAAHALRNRADVAAYKRDRLEQLVELRAECDRHDLADFDPIRSRVVELDRNVRQARSVADLDRLDPIGMQLGNDIEALVALPSHDEITEPEPEPAAIGQRPGPRPIYVLPDLDADTVQKEALNLAHGRTERLIPVHNAARLPAPAPEPEPAPDPWRLSLDELLRRRLRSYRGTPTPTHFRRNPRRPAGRKCSKRSTAQAEARCTEGLAAQRGYMGRQPSVSFRDSSMQLFRRADRTAPSRAS